MFDPVDENPPHRIVDSVENAIITDPEAISLIGSHLETAEWPGFPR
jgi:hypothetical protein